MLQSKNFKLLVVGGEDGDAPHFNELFRNRRGKCRTLNRVCAAPQLIKEHKGVRSRLAQYLNDIGHMGGECGKVHLYALHIPDVCQYLTAQGHRGAVRSGYHKPAGSHGGQEPRRFQGYGLAACVGACDYHYLSVAPKRYVHRYRCLRVKERVTGSFKLQHALCQGGDRCLHPCPQLCLAEVEEQLRHRGKVPFHGIGNTAHIR